MSDPKEPQSVSSGALNEIPLELIVSVGRVHSKIGDVVALKPDSVLELDRKINDPIELFIGDTLVATGELEQDQTDGEDRLFIRILSMVHSSAVSRS